MATSFTTWVSPVTPTITSPTASQTGVDRNPTITSSAFSSPDSLTHTSSTWQIATDSGFSSVVWSKSADTTNKVSIIVNTTNGTFAGVLSGQTKLGIATNYYVRVKYTDSESSDSAYSTGILFTVRDALVTPNTQIAELWHGIDKELPAIVSKPSQVSTVETVPTDSASDGTIRIDAENNDLYYRSNSAWILAAKVGVVVKTGDYTATTKDRSIICNKNTAMTITLSKATGSGKIYHIGSIGVGEVTLDGDGSETIDGETTQSLQQYETIQIVDYTSGGWKII
jgi:hypothetical protein